MFNVSIVFEYGLMNVAPDYLYLPPRLQITAVPLRVRHPQHALTAIDRHLVLLLSYKFHRHRVHTPRRTCTPHLAPHPTSHGTLIGTEPQRGFKTLLAILLCIVRPVQGLGKLRTNSYIAAAAAVRIEQEAELPRAAALVAMHTVARVKSVASTPN